jgi:hypothetical protein
VFAETLRKTDMLLLDEEKSTPVDVKWYAPAGNSPTPFWASAPGLSPTTKHISTPTRRVGRQRVFIVVLPC